MKLFLNLYNSVCCRFYQSCDLLEAMIIIQLVAKTLAALVIFSGILGIVGATTLSLAGLKAVLGGSLMLYGSTALLICGGGAMMVSSFALSVGDKKYHVQMKWGNQIAINNSKEIFNNNKILQKFG
ncbi:MAG: hypothetical protein KDK55_06945 [Chlamydiia bacterium]|nr:hypothetical protein [Chlamydiia bacterium]